jgi:hypothetical protein
MSDEQCVDLANDPQAYMRLINGLKQAGLDPEGFSFEKGRRPYPGFAPLIEDDAAIFFGRDAQIVRARDRIRGLARTGVERLLIILGASGAGKSSFMRAGILPRHRRDDRNWLPIKCIRPERAVLSGSYGLAVALEETMREPRFANKLPAKGFPASPGGILDMIQRDYLGLARLLAGLREAARASDAARNPITVILPIDQGEELFTEEGASEAERFIDLLLTTLAADPHLIAILAIRSDTFPRLQTHEKLAGLPKDTFELSTMLEGSYRTVIEGLRGTYQRRT